MQSSNGTEKKTKRKETPLKRFPSAAGNVEGQVHRRQAQNGFQYLSFKVVRKWLTRDGRTMTSDDDYFFDQLDEHMEVLAKLHDYRESSAPRQAA